MRVDYLEVTYLTEKPAVSNRWLNFMTLIKHPKHQIATNSSAFRTLGIIKYA